MRMEGDAVRKRMYQDACAALEECPAVFELRTQTKEVGRLSGKCARLRCDWRELGEECELAGAIEARAREL